MSVGAWIGLLGLLAAPIIILIYLIKSKYVPKTVSSTFIWRRSLKYVRRKVPINMIVSLLLIVQLIVVGAATLSLMNIHSKPHRSNASIIIVDASASMKALNAKYEKSRYDVALDKIREAAKDIDGNSGMQIIIAAEEPKTITKTEFPDDEKDEDGLPKPDSPFVYNEGDALVAVESYLVGKCTNVETDINAALEKARDGLNYNSEATIYLYTDKMFERSDSVTIVNCADPEADWNAGITSFKDVKYAAGYEYEVELINNGLETDFNVTLNVDGSIVAVKSVSMGKGETKKVVFSPRSIENSDAVKIKAIKSYKSAEIEINTDGDIILDDNKAYLYSVPTTDVRILYVSNALQTIGGSINYTKQTTLQLILGANGYVINSTDIYHASNVKNAPIKGYDLYIYEGVMPLTMPEDGAVWFINAPESPVGTNINISDVEKNATATGNKNGFVLEETDIIKGPIASILTKNVEFDEPVKFPINGIITDILASVSKYRVIGEIDSVTGEVAYKLPETFEEIYSCTHYLQNGAPVKSPVMIAGTVGTTRTIITTFDFANSSLPIFIADYPILLKNMIEYSMPDIMPNRTPTIGDVLEFNPPAGVESIIYYFKTFEEELEDTEAIGAEINRWNGESIELPTIILNELGIYNVVVNYKPETTFDEDGTVIDVAAESDTFSLSTYMPRSESDINAKGSELFAPIPEKENEDRTEFSILWVFVLIFVIFLIIEWGVYYRDEY